MSGLTHPLVIPAHAGIHGHDVVKGITQPLTAPQPWIPAWAGMTKVDRAAPRPANQTPFASSRLRETTAALPQKAIHV